MRTNLKVFRVRKGFSQEEMAEKIGYNRGTYAAIEKGVREGRSRFWRALQTVFKIPDGEMWDLMHNDK